MARMALACSWAETPSAAHPPMSDIAETRCNYKKARIACRRRPRCSFAALISFAPGSRLSGWVRICAPIFSPCLAVLSSSRLLRYCKDDNHRVTFFFRLPLRSRNHRSRTCVRDDRELNFNNIVALRQPDRPK